MIIGTEINTDMMDHLFRRESGKMVSSLTRFFGSKYLELAEDVVQETLLKAMHEWPFRGIPENPSAWLFRVAKNMVIDELRRNSRRSQLLREEHTMLRSEWTMSSTVDQALNPESIQDDTLRMMFACCHPRLPREQQVALALRTLCGFSIPEISRAFISNEETINKRLYRARQAFKKIGAVEIPKAEQIDERLEDVLELIYLLFNEGYLSTKHEDPIREDLIEEALRLGQMLCDHPELAKPQVYAFMALMILHTARTDARTNLDGELILLSDQDRTKWDQDMIRLGANYLERSVGGKVFSKFHGQAAIAHLHASAPSIEQTDWSSIVTIYDQLLKNDDSPIIHLNRAVALAYAVNPQAGLDATALIPGLENYYLYYAVRGDLHRLNGNIKGAQKAFDTAMRMTQSKAELALLQQKIEDMKGR